MPWKDGYTVSDERGVPDGEVHWPAEMRSALRVTVALASATDAAGITRESLNTPAGYFGWNRGLDLILLALDRLRLRATFAVPALFVGAQATVVARVRDAGHEIALLGLAHEDVGVLDEAEEKRRLGESLETVERAIGTRPVGWFGLPRPEDRYAAGTISPSTVRLLIEAGVEYLGNSTVDDRPHYWFADPLQRRALLALPYYYHFDDLFFSMFPARGSGLENFDSLERNWRAELAAQYRIGGITSIVIHPQAAGWPSRLERTEAFLRDAIRLPGLWAPTSAELAGHWRAAHPLEEALILPTIWQHHDDSLN